MGCDDGSGVILDTFTCTTQRPQMTVVATFGAIFGDKPVQEVGVGQSLGTVRVEMQPRQPGGS